MTNLAYAAKRYLLSILLLLGVAASATAQNADQLPSWNDGKAKQSIVAFVERVTAEGAADFVPEAERVAVFDNDGTLWRSRMANTWQGEFPWRNLCEDGDVTRAI
ncbi:hypothetical protein [Mesorhizobium temperatum]|uniref:hypothetical protein n=1 Tax=Mesorhizobium temperatum TaxID=241416 RepID=UPI001FD9495D|nr:hypothetical protein [Mesorhizobium temperatum]